MLVPRSAYDVPPFELKCKGRKQSQQRRNLKSRGYLASNSRGERSPKNWKTIRMHWPRRDGIGLALKNDIRTSDL